MKPKPPFNFQRDVLKKDTDEVGRENPVDTDDKNERTGPKQFGKQPPKFARKKRPPLFHK